jgi:hypothetical protein
MTPRLTLLVSLSLPNLRLRILALIAVFVELSRADVGGGGARGGVCFGGVGVVCGVGGTDGSHFVLDFRWFGGMYEKFV